MSRGVVPRLLPLALFFICIAVSAVILLRPHDVARDETRVSMDTFVTVRVVAANEKEALAAIAAAFAEIDRVARVLDWFDSTQVIGREIDPTDSRGVAIPHEAAAVLSTALEVARASGGALDPTIRPLTALWAFEDGPRVPDPDSIRAALPHVGYARARVDGDRLVATSPIRLDLGSVAKGYVAERAIGVLRARRAVRGALVAASGDIRAFGAGAQGRPWTVGLAHPRMPDEIIARFALVDGAVSTAGDYERAFFEGGQRYHHILDPKTGYPARRSVSTTVFAPRGELADALDTACFVLGSAEGMRLLESRVDSASGSVRQFDGCAGIWITEEEGELHVTMSKELEGKISVVPGIAVTVAAPADSQS
jgi:FAD:protein FMN transferase